MARLFTPRQALPTRGDRPEVSLIFGSDVAGDALVHLDNLLDEMGGDMKTNCLRIYYEVQIMGEDLLKLTREMLEDLNLHIFIGMSFLDLRKDAAYELLELYYPEEYRIWEKTHCDGLIFDVDRFLDSPCFYTGEVTLGEENALLVAPQ